MAPSRAPRSSVAGDSRASGIGLAVTRPGTSCVTYRLSVFAPDIDAAPVAAVGHWAHVYVDRTTRRPVPIPEAIRAVRAAAVVE